MIIVTLEFLLRTERIYRFDWDYSDLRDKQVLMYWKGLPLRRHFVEP